MGRRAVIWRLLLGVGLLLPGWVQAVEHTAVTPGLETGQLLRVTLGLVAVLISIVVAGRLLRAMNRFQTGTHGQFKLLSAISLGPRERIVLLQVGQTQLLVSIVPGRIQTLHVLDRPIDVMSNPPAPSSPFPSVLGALLKRGKAA